MSTTEFHSSYASKKRKHNLNNRNCPVQHIFNSLVCREEELKKLWLISLEGVRTDPGIVYIYAQD
jgi:hypothetical protein